MTTLELLGNACTLLAAPYGARIVSDPHDAMCPPGLRLLPASLTADAITQTDRFRAAVIGAGMTDLVSYALVHDSPDFVPGHFGGEIWEVEDAPDVALDAIRQMMEQSRQSEWQPGFEEVKNG